MEINVVNIDEVVLQDLCTPRSSSGGWKIRKVPQCLRDENKDHLYDPKIVSFGPYHHGNPKFQITEEYKYKVMQHLIPGHNDVVNNYNSFLVSIKEIRDCYVEGSTDRYSDAELARMMLLDACLLLSYMLDFTLAFGALDRVTILAIVNDILLLENQIPLWILKREVYVPGYNSGRPNSLATDQFPSTCFQMYFRCARVSKNQREVDGINSFRSVRDLKSKGILCKPSSLKTLTGIKFKSHYLFAQLELPPLRIDIISMVTYANMIAYEMSIDTSAMAIDFQITNYVNFMKSLVISAEDVKELREQGILFNGLGTDKEVVKVLQEIPAGPLISFGSFLDVKREIQHHTSSKKGIFLAELFSTHFSSPWSIMALLVVIVLLGLTLV
ncbi:UPF0481 protein At3g47200-like [Lycium barbarum]|uniref:UPF0481 protein At3g47200-like n=1 Tax=Lycium barbarum TaxID=112863 RepID=UPI00293E870A|nr:UPF0481 protein At3g47200-like [Lycium barbarum]